jgi:N-methylhydantoinase B
MRREIQVMSEKTVLTVSTDRSRLRPWGVEGGGSGGNSACTIVHADGQCEQLAYSKMTQSVGKYDTVMICTPGAGGWGDPRTRDPEKVLWDVREEFVSVQGAADRYGVIVRRTDGGDFILDLAATEALRKGHRVEHLYHA